MDEQELAQIQAELKKEYLKKAEKIYRFIQNSADVYEILMTDKDESIFNVEGFKENVCDYLVETLIGEAYFKKTEGMIEGITSQTQRMYEKLLLSKKP